MIGLYTAATPHGRIPAFMNRDADPAVQKGIKSPRSPVRDNEESARQFSQAARSMVELGQSTKAGV